MECEVTSNLELSPSLVKTKMKYFKVPDDEIWRADPLNELLLVRHGNLRLDNFTQGEIDDMVDYLCTS